MGSGPGTRLLAIEGKCLEEFQKIRIQKELSNKVTLIRSDSFTWTGHIGSLRMMLGFSLLSTTMLLS